MASSSWEVVVHINVHGQGKHLFGDGLAIWYSRHPGNLGNFTALITLFDHLLRFLQCFAVMNTFY